MPQLTPAVAALVFVALAGVWLHGRYVGRRSRRPPADMNGDADARDLMTAVAGVRSDLAELERRRAGADRELIARVRDVEDSARSLGHALRVPHVRGRWGELHLRRAVELAGLTAHCDFEEQTTHLDEDGRRARPDMLVRLAGGRCMVVDAKAPMDAWLRSIETRDEDERLALEQRHAAAVGEHVRAVAARRYPRSIPGSSPLVVVYLPGEDLLRAALEHTPSLIEDAAARDVVIVTPASLLAVLRGVALGWQEQALAHNAEQIAALGARLHDRIGIVNDHLAKLGRALDASVRAFDETVGSVRTRLLPTARGLRELDVRADRGIDEVHPLGVTPRLEDSA